ncbi:MAG: glycosyltransferase family A protein, partial [Desulfobacteraceae bacterium]|nr:glycosyltransferase family A protein [Desulfobacteraceae bacterium]
MKDKVFTVIIPTYNRSHLVLETLDSLIEQTYRPIEIILIDDGSTDNTNEVVENWKMINDDDIKLSICIIYQKNMGPSAARNRGIQESSGAYILFLDSDDKLYPQCLEIFVAAFKSRKADLIICGYDIFDDYTGQIKKKVFGRPDESQIELVL